jgi:integrase/recombinase XerD
MNHRTSGLKTEKAITGFMQHKAAEGCSATTLTSYAQHLKVWGKYAGEVDIGAVSTTDLRAFLAWLRGDYKPRRFDGSDLPLSAKTLRNYWITLSAFFRWSSVEFELDP